MAVKTIRVCDKCGKPETRLRNPISTGRFLADMLRVEPPAEDDATPVYCPTTHCLGPAVGAKVREAIVAKSQR
jgi:hypothetical protein